MLELRISAYGHYLQNAKTAAVAPTSQKKGASSALSSLFHWNLPRNPFRRSVGHAVRLNWRQVQQKGLYVSSSFNSDTLHLVCLKFRTDATKGDYVLTAKVMGEKIIEHPIVFEQLLFLQNRGETRLVIPSHDLVLDLGAILCLLNRKFISKFVNAAVTLRCIAMLSFGMNQHWCVFTDPSAQGLARISRLFISAQITGRRAAVLRRPVFNRWRNVECIFNDVSARASPLSSHHSLR